jgi:ABC-2 type transport system permease protein
MNWRRTRAVVWKDMKELVRDPITIGIAVLLPLVMLFLFGYAVTLDVKNVTVGVLDYDRSPASRDLVDRFIQSGYFVLKQSLGSGAALERAMKRGEIKLALVIPARFHAALARGESPGIQIVVDGTHSATALLVASYAGVIVGGFPTPPRPAVRLETRVWYNPQMRSINYIVPGLYGVILMAFPPLLTTLAIVREKETGTVQQIFASPLTRAEFIAGKLVPYGLVAFGEMVMVIAVGYLWFEVPFRGRLALLLAAALIYVFGTVAIGLLISTVTRSQMVATLLALVVTLMPSFLFSGLMFPFFTMPYLLQLYTMIFPGRYFIDVSRGIVLKGVGALELWQNLLLMVVYAGMVFLVAVWRFRKKVA